MDEAARKIQGIYRTRRARHHLRLLLLSVVEKVYDEDTGTYYYYNRKTGASSWVKPKGFGDQDVQATYYNQNPSVEAEDHQPETQLTEESPVQEQEEVPVELGDQETTEDHEPEKHLTEESSVKEKSNDPIELEDQETAEDHQSLETQLTEESPAQEENPESTTVKDPELQPQEDEESSDEDVGDFGPEELELVKEQFDKIDTDGTGDLSLEELTTVLRSLGENITTEQVQDLINQVDENGDGEVQFPEFVEILKLQRKKAGANAPSLKLAIIFGPEEVENIRRQFLQIDQDGSGEIDEEELGNLIQMLGFRIKDFDLKQIIDEVDMNKTGTINFSEFLHVVYNMRQSDSSGFAKLLKQGIAEGLFTDLADVLNKTKDKFNRWRNAEKIEEEERERRRQERAEAKNILLKQIAERDLQLFKEKQKEREQFEKARWKPVEGFIREVELEGDQETYANIGQYVRVHYTGTFEDGTEFESSRKRGGAFEFKVGVGDVIKGWEVAILQMSEGETCNITCSPHLAYGVKGRPPKIPPSSTLKFRIELITVHEPRSDNEAEDWSDSD